MDGDALIHQAGALRVRQQLQDLARPADAVVGANLAGFADREVVVGVQLRGKWHPGGVGVLWGLGEASVVAFDEARQEGVGRLHSGDAGPVSYTHLTLPTNREV